MVIMVKALLEGPLSFMTHLGLKRVALTCGLWYRMIPYPMRYRMHSILCPHPDSSRTKTSVEGVSVLQSRTTILVTTIPNHEAMISFWGGNKGSTYMQLLLATCCCYCCCCCSFEIKIFVHALMLPLSPVNEDSNNPSKCTK